MLLKAFAISWLVLAIVIGVAYEVLLFVKGISGASDKFSVGDYRFRPKYIVWLLLVYGVIFVTVYLYMVFHAASL